MGLIWVIPYLGKVPGSNISLKASYPLLHQYVSSPKNIHMYQGSDHYYQPKQCIIIREIPQIHIKITFAFFYPPPTEKKWVPFNEPQVSTSIFNQPKQKTAKTFQPFDSLTLGQRSLGTEP